MSLAGDELDISARAGQHEPFDSQETLARPDFALLLRNGPASSISEDDEDVSEPFGGDDRENRFHGPSSTWRSYTRDERQLFATLNQQQANDLSVHLYNAHALKARHYARDAEHLRPWSSKRKWLEHNEDGELPWHPDSRWTAWPLPPDEVPRKGEDFGAFVPEPEHGTYQTLERWTPSSDLFTELYALMLRKAKTRFRSREWTQDGLSALASADAAVPDGTDNEEPVVGPGMYEPRATRSCQPAFLADDEIATQILQPSVRHVLTKLDDLLVGLHKSRRSHHDRRTASRSRSRAIFKRATMRSEQAEERSRSRGQSSRNASIAPSAHSCSEYEARGSEITQEDVGMSPPTRTRNREQSVASDSRPLGLRDWSEVLGMASLTGWNQSVVARAARRCAPLFGETMAFRTIPEVGIDTSTDYDPESVTLNSDTEADSDISSVEQSTARGLFCPFESCSRHHQMYEHAWRWREHMKRTHKLSTKEVQDIEDCLQHVSISRAKMVSHHDVVPDEGADLQQEFKRSRETSHDEILRPTRFIRKDGKPRRRTSTYDQRTMKKTRIARDEVEDREIS